MIEGAVGTYSASRSPYARMTPLPAARATACQELRRYLAAAAGGRERHPKAPPQNLPHRRFIDLVGDQGDREGAFGVRGVALNGDIAPVGPASQGREDLVFCRATQCQAQLARLAYHKSAHADVL